MPTELSDLLDSLRDRMNDATDAQVSEALKIQYINNGIAATWPKLYRTDRDTTLLYADDTTDYVIPSAVGEYSQILKVEIESGVGTGLYRELHDYDIVPDLTEPILSLNTVNRHTDGARFRITAALPLTPLVLLSDDYDGPPVTAELPVLYAMGIVAPRRLDDRIDHKRYSVTQNANGVSTAEIMEVSQFWFAQFELLLDRMQMPLPTPGG